MDSPRFAGWDVRALEESADVACSLDRDFRITWTNPAWTRFAAENGGMPAIAERWSRGAVYVDAVPEPLRTWLVERLEDCLARDESWSHEYECSSPDVYRRFRSVVYPARGEGLLLVSSLVVEAPHGPDRALPARFDPAEYADPHGILRQCMHCRRVQHRPTERWDFVPAWVAESPPSTSHGLCPPCLDFYYPAQGPPRRLGQPAE